MDRTLLDFLFGASILAGIVPCVLLLRDINRQPPSIKWLAMLLLFSAFCDLVSVFFIFLGVTPNISSSTYWLLSTFFFSLFFYHSIQWSELKTSLIIINVAYFLFAVANFAFIQKLTVNSYTQLPHSILVLSLCIIFFFKLLKELPTQHLQRLPMFWVVSGFFVSYAGKIVIHTATHYLLNYISDNLIIVGVFHHLLSIIGNVLITIGVLLYLKQLKLDHI